MTDEEMLRAFDEADEGDVIHVDDLDRLEELLEQRKNQKLRAPSAPMIFNEVVREQAEQTRIFEENRRRAIRRRIIIIDEWIEPGTYYTGTEPRYTYGPGVTVW